MSVGACGRRNPALPLAPPRRLLRLRLRSLARARACAACLRSLREFRLRCAFSAAKHSPVSARPYRLARPRTQPFQGCYAGSNPAGDAKWSQRRPGRHAATVRMLDVAVATSVRDETSASTHRAAATALPAAWRTMTIARCLPQPGPGQGGATCFTRKGLSLAPGEVEEVSAGRLAPILFSRRLQLAE